MCLPAVKSCSPTCEHGSGPWNFRVHEASQLQGRALIRVPGSVQSGLGCSALSGALPGADILAGREQGRSRDPRSSPTSPSCDLREGGALLHSPAGSRGICRAATCTHAIVLQKASGKQSKKMIVSSCQKLESMHMRSLEKFHEKLALSQNHEWILKLFLHQNILSFSLYFPQTF